MHEALLQLLGELRYEVTEKWVRATLGGETVVDSTRALLVWEPRRVVPSYAVPIEDMQLELVPASSAVPAAEPPILHPGIPFAVHSARGASLTVRAGGEERADAAFQPDDADLAGYVVLDFDAFDAWYEEAERIVAHPREPYHDVDIRPSSRHIRVELDGRLLAESTRPTLAFETSLPTRFYLPREDIVADLRPSTTTTYCAYKGEASYWSVEGLEDVAWTYREPLHDAGRLAGLVAFYDELVDITIGENRRARPDTEFSKALMDEFRS